MKRSRLQRDSRPRQSPCGRDRLSWNHSGMALPGLAHLDMDLIRLPLTNSMLPPCTHHSSVMDRLPAAPTVDVVPRPKAQSPAGQTLRWGDAVARPSKRAGRTGSKSCWPLDLREKVLQLGQGDDDNGRAADGMVPERAATSVYYRSGARVCDQTRCSTASRSTTEPSAPRSLP